MSSFAFQIWFVPQVDPGNKFPLNFWTNDITTKQYYRETILLNNTVLKYPDGIYHSFVLAPFVYTVGPQTNKRNKYETEGRDLIKDTVSQSPSTTRPDINSHTHTQTRRRDVLQIYFWFFKLIYLLIVQRDTEVYVIINDCRV